MVKIGLVLGILLLIAGGVWVFLRRRGVGSRESVCGKCGYVVSGLPSFVCPECGADLREVGIGRRRVQTPKSQQQIAAGNFRLYILLAVWTLVYGALYLFLGARSYPKSALDLANRPIRYGLIDEYLWPYQGKSVHSVMLTPRSGAYRRITVTEEREARFRGWKASPQLLWTGDSPHDGVTKLLLNVQVDTLEARSGMMEVDSRSLDWKCENPTTGKTDSGKGPITTEVVWGWLIANGVTMPSPQVKEEAATIVDLLERNSQSAHVGGPVWATGRLERIAAKQRDALPDGMNQYAFAETRGIASDSYGPGWSIYWLSIPFGIGVYSYGVNWIWWRHRKWRRRQAVEINAATATRAGTGQEINP